MVESIGSSLPRWSREILDQPFHVNEIVARSIDLKMSEPMMLSFGTFDTRPSGWLTLDVSVDGRRAMGYGEGATLPEPLFTDDSGKTIAGAMEVLSEAVANSTGTIGEALEMTQSHRFADGLYPTARFTTEMAILDAASKANNLSMADFIGLPAEIDAVPYGKSIGGDSIASIMRQVELSLELEAKKIKLKISPASYQYVLQAIQLIKLSHPEVELMVDANGGFDPLDNAHLAMLTTLDRQGLLMIEEPVSRIGNSRGLNAVRVLREELPSLETLLCLDDCLTSLEDCQEALQEGLADVINIKPGRIGSFLQSLELVDTARSLNKQVMVGGMFEATPGRYMTTLLGAYCLSRGFTIAGDISLAQERLSEDLVPLDKQLRLTSDGRISLPRGMGWGF